MPNKTYDKVQLRVKFTQASDRANIGNSDTNGENIAISFGKLSKWYEALVPTGGSSGKILAWNTAGTAKWSDPLHPTITKSADTTSTASPAHGGTFTVVDSVTREANGHVTKINTKTITLPADSNTDTKVTQSETTTTNYRPIIFGAKNSSTVSELSQTVTDQTYTTSNMYAQPSTGTIFASLFNGVIYKSGGSWITARDNAPVYANKGASTGGSYYPAFFAKSKTGGWSMGVLGNSDTLYTTFTTDENYSANPQSNTNTYQIAFPSKNGTIALTSDLSGYLPLAGGTLTGRVTTTKCLNYLVTGSGTAGADKGSGANPRYVPAKWTFNTDQTVSDGDIIFVKIPVAGHDYGVYMSIDNGSHYYPIVTQGSSRLTTHYGNGNYAAFIFRSNGSASLMIPLAGNTDGSRVTVSGGVWQAVDYYDSGNTYDRTSQQTRIYAGGVGVFRYSLCAMNNSQRMESFTTTGDANGSPTTTKTFNTSAKFMYPPVIMYQSQNATYTNGGVIGHNYLYEQFPNIDLRYSCNKTSSAGFTQYKPVYLECTLNSDDTFSITSNGLTQTFVSGKYYILLGCMYSSSVYQLALFAQHPMFYYDGTNLNGIVFSAEEKTKLAGISSGANKTESSTNGKIKIDGTDTTVYTHPSYTSKSSGLYKITVDSTGHVSATTAVVKADITALDIPDSDTKYGISGAYGANSNTWVTTITAGGTGTTSTVPTASTSAYGITKLYNGVDSTSTGLAATANAVKTAYDKANHTHPYLPKTTYEWNKEISFGNSGYLKIGSFPMYDTNITIDINATTSKTYHGTVVIATQNVSTTSMGSQHIIHVYDDPTGNIAASLRIVWTSGSRNYDIYFIPQSWSKNFIHIRALGNYMDGATDICVSQTGTAPTTTSGLEPVNILSVTSTGNGNAVTKVEIDSVGNLAVTKGSTFSTTDEKVKATKLAQSTAEAAYYPTLVSGAGTAGVSIFDSAKINHTPGTTSVVGNTRLILGNATASGTANNEEGLLKLYSPGTSYHTLKGASTSSIVEHTLPTTGGTILNDITTSFTQTLSSGTKIGTIKINGTSTDLYCETDTTYSAGNHLSLSGTTFSLASYCKSITDWNSATTNGWYMGSSVTNAPSTAWWFGRVVAHNNKYCMQEVWQFTASTDGHKVPHKMRMFVNNVWGNWVDVTVGTQVPENAVFTDTWTAMVGATSSANGSVGYVNAVPPKDGYNTKYLRADGTWAIPPGTYTHPTYTRTDTTSTASPVHGGTFTAIDSVTSTNGHVTAVNVKTVTLPAQYVHPGKTQTDTTSTASPAHGGTFTVVDSVTRDTSGHVSGINVKTVTLPSDQNTDTKVTQSETTTTNYRPIVFGATNSTDTSTLAATTTDQTYVSTLLYAQPKDGILYANRMYLKAPGSKGQLNLITSKYNVMLRNDDSNTYFLVTAQNDPTGTWTSARPLTINNSTGVCNINGNAATATNANNIATTVTPGSSSELTNYGVIFAVDPSISEFNVARKNNDFRIQLQDGTASTAGWASLILGNATSSGTAGNKEGRIVLYSTSTSYHKIIGDATTSIYDHTLPNISGTISMLDKNGTNYWGLVAGNSKTDWVRTTQSGIIPYQNGGAGSGHSSLGTSSWYFAHAYIDTVHGSLDGNAATATKATQDESGNNIKATYAASFSISDHTITLKNKNGGSLGTVTVPDSDTKNTAGSTDTSSKIFLIGATSQAANPQTYSDNEVYATSGVLTTKKVQVGGGHCTMEYNSTTETLDFVFA